MNRVLVAGIGNLFNGDDAFGSEVARRLADTPLPPGVRVVDFGIRGLDLVYALLDGCRAAILVDASARGEPPGTVSVIEPELPDPAAAAADPQALLSPHAMEPHKVLRLAAMLGGGCRRVLLVACEPAECGDDEFGEIGLSPVVAAAVPRAVETVARLVHDLIAEEVTR